MNCFAGDDVFISSQLMEPVQRSGWGCPGRIGLRVRDRSGYETGRHGCTNADVAATGGSRLSSAMSAHGGRWSMNVEPDAAALYGYNFTGCSRNSNEKAPAPPSQ